MTTAPARPKARRGPFPGLQARFDLRDDKASDAEIEARIRKGVDLKGATPWILVFAILIASVGLNVNSTAVIIGAMLISPLMGPIQGAGLGVAIYDFTLVKRAIKNLGIATAISVVVAALYFRVTPLQLAQSELLGRTNPTLWDVLIALFGGLAGVIGMTRKEPSNVVPGVAIATALMPPACTAGYGLATGQWSFVAGALYLYAINCVFIGLATTAGIRVMGLKRRGFSDAVTARQVKLALAALALGTGLPSVYLAYRMVGHELFKVRAHAFVAREFDRPGLHVVEARVEPRQRSIDVSLIGIPLNEEEQQVLESRLPEAQLQGADLRLQQMGGAPLDLAGLKRSLLSELKPGASGEAGDITPLLRDPRLDQAGAVAAELRQLHPELAAVTLGQGFQSASDNVLRPVLILDAVESRPLSARDRRRIAEWFKVRMRSEDVLVRLGNGRS